MEQEIKLRVSQIEKSFPGVKVLDKINFTVKKGRCMCCAARTVQANPP
ncbi:hypothetical protein PATY110618_09475 [Paenibacillus typhae]|uniref:Uncharacterized protein n=1 Tax=Paenibacillus typhae TaxID=1174501 RepID=A0A1G8NXE2_9BACL|nr:hypothetical protein SAMN05216192_10925 [Paenibacillus typhae]